VHEDGRLELWRFWLEDGRLKLWRFCHDGIERSKNLCIKMRG